MYKNKSWKQSLVVSSKKPRGIWSVGMGKQPVYRLRMFWGYNISELCQMMPTGQVTIPLIGTILGVTSYYCRSEACSLPWLVYIICTRKCAEVLIKLWPCSDGSVWSVFSCSLKYPQFHNTRTYTVFAQLLRQLASLSEEDNSCLVTWLRRYCSLYY